MTTFFRRGLFPIWIVFALLQAPFAPPTGLFPECMAQAAEPATPWNEGIALLSSKQYAEAEAAFRKALAANPNDAKAQEGLGKALENQNKFDEAAKVYEHLAETLVKGTDLRSPKTATPQLTAQAEAKPATPPIKVENTPTKLGAPAVGEVIDAKNPRDGWCKATVLKIDGDKRFVTYEGYTAGWDEWLTPDRVKPRGAPAPEPVKIERPKTLSFPTTLGTPTVGEVLHARPVTSKGWFNATVLQVNGDLRFVHYHGLRNNNDGWIPPANVKPLTAAEAAAASVPHTLDGWFAKTELVYFGGGHIRSTYYWFRPDGNVYFGNPPGGLTAADFAALKKSDPKNCGTYQILGEQLTLQKAGGEPEDHTYSSGRGGVMDDSPLSRIFRFKDGAKLDGTWEVSISSNFGGVHAVGASTWIFHKDGTFEHQTYGGVETTEKRGVNGAAPGQAAGQTATIDQGKYQFTGGVLELTAADGRAETHTISGMDSEESPRILSIDGSQLTHTK